MEQYDGPVIFVDIQEIAKHHFARSEDWLKCVRAINGEALRLSKQYSVAYVGRSELTKASSETCDLGKLSGDWREYFAFKNITKTDAKQRCTTGPLINNSKVADNSKVKKVAEPDSLDSLVHFMRGVMQGILLQYLDKALRCVL